MTVWGDFDRDARRLGILNTKLARASAIFFAAAIVILVPQIPGVGVWSFVGLAAVSAIRPMLTFYWGR